MLTNDIPHAALREAEVMATVQRLLLSAHPLLVSYSGGKDSTVLLALVLLAAALHRRAGHAVPPIIVTHGDTGIENPSVSALAKLELAKVRRYAKRHDLPVQAAVATPALNDTWAVSVLSGRKLPTFVNSSSRDCTQAYKIWPMVRLRKQLLAEVAAAGMPITLTGTRFEESEGRAARMTERQESATQPWVKDGDYFLSPLAHWSADDVWETLARMRSGELDTFTDSQDVFDLYAAGGGGSCAVVGDMATEGAKKSRACGARFGCALCAAAGRDRSLENMLEVDPSYGWLRGLNRVQRFLVDTQYDFSRRNWLGRTLDDEGFLTVAPDTYSPAMLAQLLRYCLTVDAEERTAAAAQGLSQPRFELVSPQAIIAIDALWSLHGIASRPFSAIRIWRDVHERGSRYHPPENMVAFPARPLPAPRYIHVGQAWDGDEPQRYTGLRDVLMELAAGEGTPNRTTSDGRELLELAESSLFEVDAEGARMFLDWEADRMLEDTRAQRGACTRGFFYYAESGVLSTSRRHAGMLDAILRRTNWRLGEGLTGEVATSELLRRSISREERAQLPTPDAAQARAPAASPDVPLRMRLCHPVYL
ncbi:hypothetical protein D3C71_25930 [compost metagenome]